MTTVILHVRHLRTLIQKKGDTLANSVERNSKATETLKVLKT